MKVVLHFEVDVDEEGLAAYLEQYPAFADEFHESMADTLIREAVTAWDSEGLLAAGESVSATEEASA